MRKDGGGDGGVLDGFVVDDGLHILDGGEGDLMLLGGELDLGGVSGGGGLNRLVLLGFHGGLGEGGHGVKVREGERHIAATTTTCFLCLYLRINVWEFGGLEGRISLDDVAIGVSIRGNERVKVWGGQRHWLDFFLNLRGCDQLRGRQHPGSRVRQQQLC